MSVVRLPLLFIVPVVLILGSQADARATIAVELPAAVLHVLEAAGSSLQVAGMPVETEPLKAFYQQRDYQPVWIDAAGMSARGEALLQAFQNAAREGLDPTDYAPGPIVVADPGSVDRLAAAELAVSAALVRYAADVRGGRASGKIERDQRIASLTDPVAVLTAAAGAADPAT